MVVFCRLLRGQRVSERGPAELSTWVFLILFLLLWHVMMSASLTGSQLWCHQQMWIQSILINFYTNINVAVYSYKWHFTNGHCEALWLKANLLALLVDAFLSESSIEELLTTLWLTSNIQLEPNSFIQPVCVNNKYFEVNLLFVTMFHNRAIRCERQRWRRRWWWWGKLRQCAGWNTDWLILRPSGTFRTHVWKPRELNQCSFKCDTLKAAKKILILSFLFWQYKKKRDKKRSSLTLK